MNNFKSTEDLRLYAALVGTFALINYGIYLWKWWEINFIAFLIGATIAGILWATSAK